MYQALARDLAVDVLLINEGEANDAAPGHRPEMLAALSWKPSPLALYKYAVNRWVDKWCRSNIDLARYSLVLGRYLTPMSKVAWPRHLRTLVDCDDAFYRYAPSRDTAFDRAITAARGRLRTWQTRAAIRQYDHAFFCSKRDRQLFPARSSSVLVNVVDAPRAGAGLAQASAPSVLIVGSMSYPPNRHGVDWFLERCWPALAERCPELTLRIVGAARVRDRQRWSQAVRVEAPGFVDDLAAEYGRALFAVAPIHYGGGTSIKFLEACAFGRPSVVTGHVFRGFSSDFRPGESVLVATSAQQMVDECLALANDARQRELMGQRAHDVVASRFTVKRFEKTVRRAVRALLHS